MIERNDDGAVAVTRGEQIQVFQPDSGCVWCGDTAGWVVVDGKTEPEMPTGMGIAVCDEHYDQKYSGDIRDEVRSEELG